MGFINKQTDTGAIKTYVRETQSSQSWSEVMLDYPKASTYSVVVP